MTNIEIISNNFHAKLNYCTFYYSTGITERCTSMNSSALKVPMELKHQFVPTMITRRFFSPVVIAQICDVVKQLELNEKVVAIAERTLH